MLRFVLAILLLVAPTVAAVSLGALPVGCLDSQRHVDCIPGRVAETPSEWQARLDGGLPAALRQEEGRSSVPQLRDVSFGGATRIDATFPGELAFRESSREPATLAVPVCSSLQVLYCRWLI
ncbi:hypothetical protein [Rubinisphaera margarita]|uniref:hypothetical protein n=1 Tax=Rubinisphaera margarita TaxID=2909586 RepID=UPI001EE7A579|nr:hypothetical protein [Rubinisphaera margarita]MCG6155906.1 hypothetical protein [Rubinisphaera margarita]